MIINSQSAQLIRDNATRLAKAVRTKDDLTELATASSFEQVFGAIEGILTNTDMFFDDELLSLLDEESWKNFKATLLVYTLNLVNKYHAAASGQMHYSPIENHRGIDRDFEGASSHP